MGNVLHLKGKSSRYVKNHRALTFVLLPGLAFRCEGKGSMRWFVLAFLYGISGSVCAGPVFLIPADNPKPSYPRALYRAGIMGEVRVSMIVHADGTVSQPAVQSDANPELAEASVSAVKQWRFQPWEISDDRPAQIEVVAPMVFKLDQTPPIHANEQLKKLRCSDVSRVAQHYSEFSWMDLPVFNWTRSYLTYSIAPTLLPEERRLALIAKLNKEVPSIVRRCNTSPTSRYVRFLPKDIRQLL